jgi:hypothetical protein
MSSCPHTGLSVPECSCTRCIEQQLERFAPDRPIMHRAIHGPLVARSYSPSTLITSRFERRPSNSQ